MYSTQVYLYTPRQIVVLYDGTSSRRYQTVYAKNLKLHKGVDNKLQFQFINQEEKPVDITGKEITFRFINYDGTTVLVQKSLSLLLPLTGIAQLELNAGDIEDIDPQNGFYSLEIPTGSFDFPVFVDSDSGARGKMSIVNSVLPNFLPSMEVTIPSHTTPNVGNPAVTFYSSQINTHDTSVVSVQTNFTNYIGDIQLQGSTTGSEWYNINDPYQYPSATSDTIGSTIIGFHPYIRFKFISTSGTVDKILVR